MMSSSSRRAAVVRMFPPLDGDGDDDVVDRNRTPDPSELDPKWSCLPRVAPRSR